MEQYLKFFNLILSLYLSIYLFICLSLSLFLHLSIDWWKILDLWSYVFTCSVVSWNNSITIPQRITRYRGAILYMMQRYKYLSVIFSDKIGYRKEGRKEVDLFRDKAVKSHRDQRCGSYILIYKCVCVCVYRIANLWSPKVSAVDRNPKTSYKSPVRDSSP